MAKTHDPRPDAYYAWYRPTDEYLAAGTGWTKDLREAHPFLTRDRAWETLKRVCGQEGLDPEKGCVSIGRDVIDTDPPA